MKKLLVLSVICLLSVWSFAQEDLIRCGNSIHQEALKAEFPDFEQNVKAVYDKTSAHLSQPQLKSSGVVYTIPVVVHVVYRTSAENISDAQIQSQLDVLNLDYRMMNPDAPGSAHPFGNLATDAEIEFCLASVDPNGNPTTGITRTQTNKNGFSVSLDEVKSASAGGKNAWASNRYMNIWVCKLAPTNTGVVLGYATPPNSSIPISRDGVVIGYEHFGTVGEATYPYNRGRTATHEVGHYLGLRHIWGDDEQSPQGIFCSQDDGISDTPFQALPYGGCPNSGFSCNSTDMYMNYMDYTDDRCMSMFTKEQAMAMRFVIENYRSTFLSSTPVACDPTGGEGAIDLTEGPLVMGFEGSDNYTAAVINDNNDDKFWQISEGIAPEWGPRTGSNCMAYLWNEYGNADDWFFTPRFQLKEGRQYELRFWYATAKDNIAIYPEKFRVVLSSEASPDGEVAQLDYGEVVQPYDPNQSNNNYQYEVIELSTQSGDSDTHIGFHCYSDANQYALLIDDIEIVDVTPVANENVLASETLKAYPNPASDQLNMELNFENSVEDMQVNLVDIQGRNLHTATFEHYSTGNLQLNVSDYPSGVYFIHIQADEAILTRKIVISK